MYWLELPGVRQPMTRRSPRHAYGHCNRDVDRRYSARSRRTWRRTRNPESEIRGKVGVGVILQHFPVRGAELPEERTVRKLPLTTNGRMADVPFAAEATVIRNETLTRF